MGAGAAGHAAMAHQTKDLALSDERILKVTNDCFQTALKI